MDEPKKSVLGVALQHKAEIIIITAFALWVVLALT